MNCPTCGHQREKDGQAQCACNESSPSQYVFVVVIKDRHADVDAEVYAEREAAIERARALAQEYCRFPEDLEESPISGWEFHVNYSCENDCIYVLKREVKHVNA